MQADQITERLAMASYPRPREMIFHCHNSLDWIMQSSDSEILNTRLENCMAKPFLSGEGR